MWVCNVINSRQGLQNSKHVVGNSPCSLCADVIMHVKDPLSPVMSLWHHASVESFCQSIYMYVYIHAYITCMCWRSMLIKFQSPHSWNIRKYTMANDVDMSVTICFEVLLATDTEYYWSCGLADISWIWLVSSNLFMGY